MRRATAALAAREYDLVIVGGGIFGACAAWDAVLRGLSVALVERDDFGAATSANSFRIVHGGIRYLQHADIARVRASCRERSALLRVAPHLVHPLPIVIPTYGHGTRGKGLLGAGLLAYDLLTVDRNRGIGDPERRIPRSRYLSRSEVLGLFPDLDGHGLTGAALFCDGQIYNPTRLVVSFLRAASEQGVEAANYVEAVGFLIQDRQVAGIEAWDRLTGERFPVRGRCVLNAAGPWAERLVERSLGRPLARKSPFSRDACLVIRDRLHRKYALAVQGRTRDPDAVLSRGARHLFAVPWRHYTLIGVWHAVYEGHPDAVSVGDDEIERFIAEINAAYPGFGLEPEDVLLWNAGLVPFGENPSGATDLSYGKRSLIIDHGRTAGLEGLVTLIGVRYTMARSEAAGAVDLLARKVGRKTHRPATDYIPVHGGRFERMDALLDQASRGDISGLPVGVKTALLHNYGSEYGRVLRYAAARPALLETVGNSTVLKAEVIHAVREEMAVRLADVVLRRTDLGTAEYPGDEALRSCAELMGTELGWPRSRLRQEVDELKRSYPGLRRAPAAAGHAVRAQN